MEWKKARKKPVVIDWLGPWDGTDRQAAEIYHLCGRKLESGNRVMYIHTLEGEMRVSPGDIIIRGVQGEIYACKPDIFAATYDVVED